MSAHRIICGVSMAIVAITFAILLVPNHHDPCAGGYLTPKLLHLSTRLSDDKPITIVALGSSSTEGQGASQPENNYPNRLTIELRNRFPGRTITVINRGVGGDTIEQMVARLDRDVFTAHPDLVIWQVGSNDVLYDLDTNKQAIALRNGLMRMKDAGIDVILMDMQYSPVIMNHAGYRDMLHTISAAGYAFGIPVFHRFRIMQDWDESELMPQQATLYGDQLHMNDRSYACLAQLLADGVATAAR